MLLLEFQTIQKNIISMHYNNITNRSNIMNNYKYNKLLSPQQLNFMQYYMLPEKNQFDYVYRPGDDSFLMLSVLKNEYSSFPPNPTICEVGSGSGILSLHLNKWLKQANNNPFLHISTDISPDACIFSTKYYEHYNAQIDQICTSLLKCIRLQPQIIICNPPYVPTEIEQKQNQLKYLQEKITSVSKSDYSRSPNKNLIAYSYMGGPDGLDTTRKLIQLICWECRLYLIVMGEEGLEILSKQISNRIIISQNVKAKVQVLQFFKKANQQLFVILIQFRII